MKKYLIIFVNQVLVQLTYKFNFLTKIFNTILGVVVSILTWVAIYDSVSQNTIGLLSKSQMIFYIGVVNFSVVLFSTVEVVRLGSYVKNGKLTMHLLRPYSFLGHSFADYLGNKVIYLLFYVLFMLLTVFSGANFLYLIHLFIFLIVNIVLFFMLISCIGTLGFWLIQMWPLRPIMNAIYLLFGGLLFPLHLLPASIYTIVSINPFALIGYHYTLALQQTYSFEQIRWYILLSTIWATFFYISYKWLFKKGLRKYEGMGA